MNPLWHMGEGQGHSAHLTLLRLLDHVVWHAAQRRLMFKAQICRTLTEDGQIQKGSLSPYSLLEDPRGVKHGLSQSASEN